MNRRRCHSFLGPDIEQFLSHKRSLGRRYDSEEKTLALFDAYLLDNKIGSLTSITSEVVDAFLLSRPRSRPRSYNHLRCTLGRLFTYLINHRKLDVTPLQSPSRRSRYQRTPFIFDVATARRLLALAKTLQDTGGTSDRGNTYFVLFAVLYGLGLRVGEACRLRIGDANIEQQLLLIRETKFYKSRLVPFGPKLGEVLAQHIQRRKSSLSSLSPDEQPLFSLRSGRPVNPGTVSQTFHTLIPRLHLELPMGVSSPRLHDLRHSFAVGTLTRWYKEGLDPGAQLLTLSTFLGHVDVNSTALYLTTTPELLDEANHRFKTFAAATREELL